MALENTETDLQVTKNDLRLACQRIQDLQSALEDDLDSGTDVPDDRYYLCFCLIYYDNLNFHYSILKIYMLIYCNGVVFLKT